MPYHWERPTAEQAQRGIIAVYVLTHYIWIDGKNIPVEMPCPYKAINIERRIERGGDLPRWIEVVKHVAIVGSRGYTDTRVIIGYINSLPENTVIVSGGARGVDSIAETAAKQRGLDTLIFPAEWDKHGKSAGFRRNADIVNKCDRLVAFWDGKSKGTAHSIGLARKQGKRVDINPKEVIA